jgi:hypothetical protein
MRSDECSVRFLVSNSVVPTVHRDASPLRRVREETPQTRTRDVRKALLALCVRDGGLRPLLGPNLRGKILPRSHPPRIQRRSSRVLQECVLLRRCTLLSTSPETQPHLPSGTSCAFRSTLRRAFKTPYRYWARRRSGAHCRVRMPRITRFKGRGGDRRRAAVLV